MLVATRDFDWGDEKVKRGQKVVGLSPRLAQKLLNARYVVEVEEHKGPTQLVVTNRPRRRNADREPIPGFPWKGKWLKPGDVMPEEGLTPDKRRVLLNVDWVREVPVPKKTAKKPRKPAKKKQTAAKKTKKSTKRKRTKRLAA